MDPHASTPLTSSSSLSRVPRVGPTELSPEEVVARRAGEVLLRHTILKSDHFPGCQNMRLTPLLEGAPNFRQVSGLPVYGVAIPTVSGLRHVLDLLGATKGRRKVLWHNLREEPVLYINGRPFVVREADKPFANLEYTGIDRERVEDMEARLKSDVLAEAGVYGGLVMVAHEDDQFQVIQDWEPVTETDIQTPAEVYRELLSDGYDIDYLRVPITDEKAPKGGDFESIISRCWAPPEGAALVFNCQMGRGRTTTGMVIGCLLALRRSRGILAPPPTTHNEDIPDWFIATAEDVLSPLSPAARAAQMGALADASSLFNDAVEEAEMKAGMYTVIRSLLRALERGREAKSALDLVLDACASMQNLREAIASYRTRLFYEPNDMRRQSLLQVCQEYLERYFVLVAFSAYLDDPSFLPGEESHVTFAQWTSARPELQGILYRLLRANPLAALALDRPTTKGVSTDQGPPKAAAAALPEISDEYEEILARRNGSVLGPHTILKQDHFPGCQNPRLPLVVPGAPNFRGVPGDEMRVYGGAIATADGVRGVLEHLRAGPLSDSSSPEKCTAVWHMMREEPVVYINGLPYVLREESRPFKNLMEYRGIDADRLDQMEQRLRDDILSEAASRGGRLLVTLESGGEGAHGLRQEFVDITGPNAVETPRMVFEALQAEGYRVTFVRVPLTDGTCPRPADFDVFYSAAAAASSSDALIYTCQLGGGRTTTGMAIGALLRLHLTGATIRPPSELERKETLARLDEDLGGASPRGTSDDEEDNGISSFTAHENNDRSVDRRENMSNTLAMGRVGSGGLAWRQQSPYFTRSLLDVQRSGSLEGMTISTGTDPETKNMEDGEYVGSRRFVRTLERGAEAKAEVDQVVDACGWLINLRTAIMRYRRPKTVDKFFRPEIQARHSAFQRGSAYLERYCMLMAFAVYLRQRKVVKYHTLDAVGPASQSTVTSFEDWFAARPDVVAAREAIHQNPAGALAPVPAILPLTPATVKPTPLPSLPGKDVPVEEQRRVLLRRRGSTVGRRSILKSFTMTGPGAVLAKESGASVDVPILSIEGVTDVRKALNLPVYTLGNATVNGLRRLFSELGGGPEGATHIVITDVREELVLYVNGTAYLRRELEMPAAALHHAGIQASKLEEMERRLQMDIMTEAVSWGGRVLLHKEVESVPPTIMSMSVQNQTDTKAEITQAENPPMSNRPESVVVDSVLGRPNGSCGVLGGRPPSAATDDSSSTREDITRTTEYQPGTQVAAFWESITGEMGDIDEGMSTPAEVFSGLAAQGYQISYRRTPMSRERTPQAIDLDHLYTQMKTCPQDKMPLYLFVSRTAAGSSTRFAAAFSCAVLQAQEATTEFIPQEGSSPVVYGSSPVPSGPLSGTPDEGKAHGIEGTSSPPFKRSRASGAALLRNDSELSDLVRSMRAGEYRGVMNLCRVLPRGAEAKEAVDDAIDACAPIGNLREDILRCKEVAESDESLEDMSTAAARHLGLHYLQRYFFLIAFRAYLESMWRGITAVPFSEWVAERKEIMYLLSNLDLE